MILIADGGSTKVKWALLNGQSIVKEFTTSGINPVTMKADVIKQKIATEVVPQLLKAEYGPIEVYYYGAGCRNREYNLVISSAISENFLSAKIVVDSDIVGAAISLFGKEKGIACIIGTGSNSCRYDGEKIVEQVPSLGYILGDEGSGTYLGKMFLNRLLKKGFSKHLKELFYEKYPIGIDEVINNVYHGDSPNQFLSSFVPFIIENKNEKEVHEIITMSFKAFFENNVLRYEEASRSPIGFVGSVAFLLKDILEEVAATYDCKISEVTASPMHGLIKFYSNK